jgi:Ca2+/Na+ antiporter
VLALINPIKVSPLTILTAEIVLLLSLGFTLYLTIEKKMSWKHGLIMIGMYVVFIIISLLTQKV